MLLFFFGVCRLKEQVNVDSEDWLDPVLLSGVLVLLYALISGHSVSSTAVRVSNFGYLGKVYVFVTFVVFGVTNIAFTTVQE